MAEKKSAKKPTKKPAAKSPAKKPAAKSPAKKPAAKKPAAKNPAKKPAKKGEYKRLSALDGEPIIRMMNGRRLKPAKKVHHEIKRVAPRILRKPTPPPKPQPKPVAEIDTTEAVEAASSIALALKQRAAAAQNREGGAAGDVRLSRRPTTRSQGRTTDKFPAADLKDFKRRLIEARKQALSGVSAMKATGFNEADDHEADGGDGTNQTLRLQALGQMGTINRTIQQIEEALHRIEDGTYGVCTICGQLIRKPRLLNQPFVLTCMECQNEMERQNR